MRKLVLVVVLVGVSSLGYSQRASDFEARYKRAYQLLLEENYDKARTEFYALSQNLTPNNPYAPYSVYFAGLACFKTNLHNNAKSYAKLLIERYPDWNRLSDGFYLYANVCFVQQNYAEGIEYLRRITDPAVKKDADVMEDFYLGLVANLGILKTLYNQFPDDRVIAVNLADLIERTSSDKKDLELSDRITNRYGVKKPRPTIQPPTNPTASTTKAPSNLPIREKTSKGFFNIGVLFPFNMSELDPDNRVRANQFALDMYEGVKLAKSKLQSEGITINLFAYDVDNQPNAMTDLINNTSFAQMDLLVGPLHVETNKLAVSFCNQMKIPMVNPLATDKDLVINQPYIYLGQPSLSLQAKKIAAFSQQNFVPRTAVILYNPNRVDSLLAAFYQQELTKIGVEVVANSKIGGTNTESYLAAIPEVGNKKIGHVFLASYSKNGGVSLLSAMDKKKIFAPVITRADVFPMQSISKDQLSGKEIYIMANDFVDESKPEVQQFRQLYMNRRGTVPSSYAYQGYDMMLFFGRMMGKFTPQMKVGLDTQAYPEGYTLSGFDYTLSSNENKIVPLFKYENYRFVPVKMD